MSTALTAAVLRLFAQSEIPKSMKAYLLERFDSFSKTEQAEIIAQLRTEAQNAKKILLKLEVDLDAAVKKAEGELEKLAAEEKTTPSKK